MPDYQQKDFHTVTAYVYGRLDLVDFLVQVLGAKERQRGSNPEMFHGEFTIGDSVIMVGIGKSIPPEFRPPAQWGVRPDSKEPPPGTFYVYVSDVDIKGKTMTVLTPAPGPLPSMFWLMGTIKWIDT